MCHDHRRILINKLKSQKCRLFSQASGSVNLSTAPQNVQESHGNTLCKVQTGFSSCSVCFCNVCKFNFVAGLQEQCDELADATSVYGKGYVFRNFNPFFFCSSERAAR